jgi:hypothetical protein
MGSAGGERAANAVRDDPVLRCAAQRRATNELRSKRPELGEDLLAEEPHLLSQFG